MIFTPFPQQRIAGEYLDKNRIAMLAMGCGLGKTSTVLQFISDLFLDGASKGVLIVAPLRVANNVWPSEIEQWDNFKWMQMYSLRTDEGKAAWHRGELAIYLINYDLLQQFSEWALEKAKSIPVDTVVWDEISLAKNPTSKRINAIRKFNSFFKRRIGLTGSMASQGYLDLFAMYRLLDDGQRLGKHITHYKTNYFVSDYMGYNWTLRDGAKERIQELISDITLVLRSEDYLKIPETIHHDVNIALPLDLRKQYNSLEKELLLTTHGKEIVASNAAVLAGKLLQFLSGAVYDSDRDVVYIHDLKLQALKQVIAKVKKPVIVAVAYTHEKQRILESIPGAEIFDDNRIVAWNRGEIPVLVIHPRSGGHGTNLQHGGSVTVWFSLTHSWDMTAQLNARTARTGQKDITEVYRLLIENSYDWAVVDSLKNHKAEQGSLLQSLKNLKRLRESS